jgi:hypothetical protein
MIRGQQLPFLPIQYLVDVLSRKDAEGRIAELVAPSASLREAVVHFINQKLAFVRRQAESDFRP